MRLELMPVNISLGAMLCATVAMFSVGKETVRRFAITLATLTALDLLANLVGLGPFFWWSPLHWPSTIALGADEIVENHGVVLTTVGYIADLVIWAIVITAVICIARKRKNPNKTPEHISKGRERPSENAQR